MPEPNTIYLVNESLRTQVFWCFLARPQELQKNPLVLGNSSTYLAVASNSPSIDTFTIQVQYGVGAGASDQPLGKRATVESAITLDAKPTDQFLATYPEIPPNIGPTLEQNGSGAAANGFSVKSSPFDEAEYLANGWFANQSYGLRTYQGFIGMTWAPLPNQTQTLTPALKFYISIGPFSPNLLVTYSDILESAATVAPGNFSATREATVTYTSSGTWAVTAGRPPTRRQSLSQLVHLSHQYLGEAHEILTKTIGKYSPRPVLTGARRAAEPGSNLRKAG